MHREPARSARLRDEVVHAVDGTGSAPRTPPKKRECEQLPLTRVNACVPERST